MKISNWLKLGFWTPVVFCGLMVVGYESGFFSEGELVGNKLLEYYYALTMELVTICLIPLSLMFLRLKFVKAYLKGGSPKRLGTFQGFRLAMLSLPMTANMFLYYQFIHPSFGYMAIISLLCSVFIYPSDSRCQAEEKDLWP